MIDFKADEEDTELLMEYLTLLAGKKVSVKTPERGDARALCAMAYENAKEAARQYKLDAILAVMQKHHCLIFYILSITPQPILSPELPEGCVVKSSRILWITSDLPMMSSTLTRPV